MKKAAVRIAMALMGAALISLFSGARSYEERLIRAGVKDAFGPEASGLLDERPELQALFLDYSETPDLVFKARIAISKYGDAARNILAMYGAEPEFRDVLSRYGENVVPVIQYFIENDPFSIHMAYAAQQTVQRATEKAKDLWNRVAGQGQDPATPNATNASTSYGPTERGWHAVQNIRTRGHDFLGQFEMAPGHKAKWIQTERILEGTSSFFASGVRNLETKYVIDEPIEAADLFWAGVDAAVFMSAVKALRVVRVARAGEALGKSGKELSLLKRTQLFAGRLIPKNTFGRAILKGGAGAGILYVVIKHPGVLNSIFTEAAKVLGLNPLLVQIACWAILIFAICLPLTPILRIFLPLVIRALSLVVGALAWLERKFAINRAKTLSGSIQAEVAEPA